VKNSSPPGEQEGRSLDQGERRASPSRRSEENAIRTLMLAGGGGGRRDLFFHGISTVRYFPFKRRGFCPAGNNRLARWGTAPGACRGRLSQFSGKKRLYAREGQFAAHRGEGKASAIKETLVREGDGTPKLAVPSKRGRILLGKKKPLCQTFAGGKGVTKKEKRILDPYQRAFITWLSHHRGGGGDLGTGGERSRSASLISRERRGHEKSGRISREERSGLARGKELPKKEKEKKLGTTA